MQFAYIIMLNIILNTLYSPLNGKLYMLMCSVSEIDIHTIVIEWQTETGGDYLLH